SGFQKMSGFHAGSISRLVVEKSTRVAFMDTLTRVLPTVALEEECGSEALQAQWKNHALSPTTAARAECVETGWARAKHTVRSSADAAGQYFHPDRGYATGHHCLAPAIRFRQGQQRLRSPQ